MGESVIRMKPIAHEMKKSGRKTGEQKMVSPEMAVKMLKRKKKWAKNLDKELSPIILRIMGCMLLEKLPKSGKRSLMK